MSDVALHPDTGAGAPSSPPAQRAFHIVVNLRAGTALGLTRSELERTISAPFVAAGHRLTLECLMPEHVDDAVKRAAASDADTVIVGGGDGTVRAAARHIIGTDKILGILPLGTMNRMAKDLEIPLTLGAAAEFLATRAEPHNIDVASVNDTIFLCNSVMGATLRYSVVRARMRGQPASVRIPKYLSIFREILASRRKLSIIVDNGEERVRLRALSIAVTNNGYDETMSWFRRPHLASGKLTMYVSKHRSGFGLVKALARALIGRWYGDPEMVKLTGSEFVVHTNTRRKRLANDGEIAKFETPLRYVILPRALRVLMQADGMS